MQKIARALLSVYDKTGVVEFARELAANGVELISTGGTARTLREAGLAVVDVREVTGSPEMMEGRVKTLHPKIHGGLLALLDNPEHVAAMREHGIESIDLAVINLYPFESTMRSEGATHEEIVEQIDIGGPAMVRAAAKNYRFTAVLTSPQQYDGVLAELRSSGMTLGDASRLNLAAAAFAHTAAYDRIVADYFAAKVAAAADSGKDHPASPFGRELSIGLPLDQALRYGENPHQQAALYGSFTDIFRQLHGKELSYNNIVDIDAAAKLVLEFEEPTVVIVKHTNPCGVGSAATLADAWHKAFATDVKSPYGGIVAVNRPLDLKAAGIINEIFTEVVIAPSFPEETLELLRRKRDRRLIVANYEALRASFGTEVKSIAGGVLAQTSDAAIIDEGTLRVATRRKPTEQEMRALMFAWRVAKHVKSNAIVYALEDRTLGIGAGQMSRVDSAATAARKAALAGLDLAGCAVASDAFFPFADGLLEAVEAGATLVIQPGGSIRDQDVIDAADANDIAMVMTGMRHFRH
ncbi:MAG: bifunctional phosphoribosylaminoimidazolecarboxamide formyltransferase/IMP cyclohydrolase [Bacteroidetes bacterium]|nr:bifunctional phosphoribosylaminoimidazolecarboxamide formyltransferase/IMP cyclohydrolase [Bacteroidota bacterium]